MNCQWQENQAYRFADGSLAPARKQAFTDHLDNCAVCQTRVAEAERLEDLLRGALMPVPAPTGFAARVAQAVVAEREERRPRLAFPSLFGRRRLSTALASLLVAVLMVVVAGGPEGALAVVQRALFFIPGMGINAVDATNLVATQPATVRLGSTTFTVEALLSDGKQTTVRFSLTGLPGGKQGWEMPIQVGGDPKSAQPSAPPRQPRLSDAAGNQYPLQFAMQGTGGSADENHVSGTLTFAGLRAGTQAVDLSVPIEFVVPAAVQLASGLQPTDSWEAHLVLAPPTGSGLPLAVPQTTAATVNGVTLRVAASA
ncbi:MAG: anti-sigma factor family protein [Chloroflexota bacterium]